MRRLKAMFAQKRTLALSGLGYVGDDAAITPLVRTPNSPTGVAMRKPGFGRWLPIAGAVASIAALVIVLRRK